KEVREAVFDGEGHEVTVYERDALRSGDTFKGPCVVEGGESTLVVRPDDEMKVDEYGNLVVEVGE
ncbi:MAG: hydantoinase/oxoprolinase family protein, partial [Halobacteria archaeon]|nr:hydantoinase/oxoprolinase family protein [Halobacteria archaeon]